MKSYDSNTYTYDFDGIRTSKTVNGVKHTYTLEGTNIVRETWGANELIPMYDTTGSVYGIIYNTVPYIFSRNLQGDILSIATVNGTIVAKYSYDAWHCSK